MLSGRSLGHPWVSPQTQAHMVSGGSLGHPGIFPWCPLRHRPTWCLEDPLDILGSSLGVPSDTGSHGVRRIPWTSRDPPLGSRQTQASMLSRGSLGHPGILPWCPVRYRPPCCPEDQLDILRSSLGVPSGTGLMLSGGSLGHPEILPRCPVRHRPPSCPKDPLNISGFFLGVPSHTGSQACQPLQFKTLELRWGEHCMLHLLGGCGPNAIISGIILSL